MTFLSTDAEYVNAKYIQVNRLPNSSHETIITTQTESQFPLRTSTNDTVTNEKLKIESSLNVSAASRQAQKSGWGKTILVHLYLTTF